MPVFTVHEPPRAPASAAPIRSALCLCATDFIFWAFLLTPLWMLRHRLWLVLVIYLVVVGRRSRLRVHFAGVGVAGIALVGCCHRFFGRA